MTIVNNYPAVPYFNDIMFVYKNRLFAIDFKQTILFFKFLPPPNRPLDVINSYYQNIYIKPYCRIGPYLIGLLLAYAIIINQNSRKLTKVIFEKSLINPILIVLFCFFRYSMVTVPIDPRLVIHNRFDFRRHNGNVTGKQWRHTKCTIGGDL